MENFGSKAVQGSQWAAKLRGRWKEGFAHTCLPLDIGEVGVLWGTSRDAKIIAWMEVLVP